MLELGGVKTVRLKLNSKILLVLLSGCGNQVSSPLASIDIKERSSISLSDHSHSSDELDQRGLGGWNIMKPNFLKPNRLDGISIEWDYFMIHDKEGKFTGIIGNTVTDPRQKLSGSKFQIGGLDADVMPSGANLAFVGMFADGKKVSEFINFAPNQSAIGSDARTLDARMPGGAFTREYPVLAESAGGDRILLEGRTNEYEFSLEIAPDFLTVIEVGKNKDAPFSARTGWDVGYLPGENWTVHMVWPRTLVKGWIRDLATGSMIPVDGHGYRENSWGRWAFALDGWDFGIFSDGEKKVQWAWQSYHKSKTQDVLDVAFMDQGELKTFRFFGETNQVGWYHDTWRYDERAGGCIPNRTKLIAKNDGYTVEAELEIGTRQIPLLSNVTFLTKIYYISEQFPLITGRITRNDDKSLVTTFSGIMGGEFSKTKNSLNRTCLGHKKTYSLPIPQ